MAGIVGTDQANDLAILLVAPECQDSLSLGPPLRLGSTKSIRQGERVVTFGYPLPSEFADKPQVSAGIIKSTSGLEGDPRTFTISNTIQPGNSGAPLFGPDGSVIGVVTSTLSIGYLYPRYEALPQDLNFAVKSDYVHLLYDLTVPSSSTPAESPGQSGASVLSDLPSFVSGIQRNVVLIVATANE